jgi:hypothetical protein
MAFTVMTTRDEYFAAFPTFGRIFWQKRDGVPLHLPLLGIGEDADVSVRVIRKVCFESPDPRSEIQGLLRDLNWRPHLVAAIALMVCERDDGLMADLWCAFDEGSWVSPQLAVAAFCLDPEFGHRASTRIDLLCVGPTPRANILDPASRHSASGPESDYGRRCKALSTLVWLASRDPDFGEWTRAKAHEADVAGLIGNDIHRGDRICEHWSAGLLRLLVSEGMPLPRLRFLVPESAI